VWESRWQGETPASPKVAKSHNVGSFLDNVGWGRVLFSWNVGTKVRCSRAGRFIFSRRYSYQPYSTRRLRQVVKQYASAAGIAKRVYPHLFRHQLITYLTKHGMISPKLQLLSGHTTEQSLAVYRDLALADVSGEYEEAMKTFPVR
jgi:integrase